MEQSEINIFSIYINLEEMQSNRWGSAKEGLSSSLMFKSFKWWFSVYALEERSNTNHVEQLTSCWCKLIML